ncbi:MAG: energy-coupling factor ABC transporter ATP-binding protein [Desulfurococcaceae archaeon]
MSEEVVIEARDVWFKYNKKQDWVLRGVNVVIRRGEFVGVIGESGAGKTTLAKHFNGLLKPLRGEVRVLGMDTRKVPTSRLARHVGLVFQNPDSQIYSATIRDELSVGLKKLGFSEAEIEERIKWAMEVVDLKKPLDMSPHVLSFGERHRLAIATILALKPDVFVLDEPFAGIDYKRSLQLLEIFKELTKKGHSVVLIAHDLQLIAELADRVIVMSKGVIAREGSTEEVLGDVDFLAANGFIPLQVSLLALKLGLGRVVRVSDFAEEVRKRLVA